jgi:hypothetical protein
MTIEQALDALAGNSRGPALRAHRALRAAGPNVITDLLRIAADARHVDTEVPDALVGCTAWLLFFTGLTLLILSISAGYSSALLGLAFLLLGNWLFVSAPARSARSNRARDARDKRVAVAHKLLEEWDDLRGIGPLCASLPTMYPSYYVPPIQQSILTRLLPRLTDSDSDLLRAEHRSRLYPYLQIDNAFEYSDFLIAILHAIEQLQDTRAIAYVRALAGATVTSLNGTRVRALARRCLPILEKRLEAELAGRTLLRASDGPEEEEYLLRPADLSTGILLRPSGGAPITPPELLLRSEPDDGRTD